MKEVFSSGGGTQSCAIAALIIQGKLPKPDFSLIADTTKERGSTWAYLNDYVNPALRSIGVEILRLDRDKYAYSHDDCFNNKGTLLLPAFTSQSGGKPGKMKGFCNSYWKRDVVDNFLLREHGIGRNDYRKWIGFSLDESTRVIRMMGGEEWDKGLLRFPLVHDVPMKRRQSIKLVESMGWPTPPRSACWMCPNQGDHEWRDLRDNYPEEFAKAVELEREIQKRDPFAWLHGSGIPLDQVDFTQPEDLFNRRPCDSGNCFT